MRSAKASGERDRRKARPSSVRASPTRFASTSISAFQYGGTVSTMVTRFDGPTMSTPQAKASGVKVSPARVA